MTLWRAGSGKSDTQQRSLVAAPTTYAPTHQEDLYHQPASATHVPTRASPLGMLIYAFQSMGYMPKARGRDTVGREVRGAGDEK
jgi:hypothetical protein